MKNITNQTLVSITDKHSMRKKKQESLNIAKSLQFELNINNERPLNRILKEPTAKTNLDALSKWVIIQTAGEGVDSDMYEQLICKLKQKLSDIYDSC